MIIKFRMFGNAFFVTIKTILKAFAKVLILVFYLTNTSCTCTFYNVSVESRSFFGYND